MKKILAILTGIAVIIVILIAGACSNSAKQEAEGEPKAILETDTITSEDFPDILVNDSELGISLEETLIGCKRHLIMQNVSHTGSRGKEIVDSLFTDVYYGDIVHWAKNRGSLIHLHHIRLIDPLSVNKKDTCLVAQNDDEFRGVFKLEIPYNADTGVFKYEIIFKVKNEYWCIDPYLRIRGTRPQN
jgi:hypothetical protein